jgi:hypothetical protein
MGSTPNVRRFIYILKCHISLIEMIEKCMEFFERLFTFSIIIFFFPMKMIGAFVFHPR